MPALPGSQSHSCPVLSHAISFLFYAAFKIFSPTLVFNTDIHWYILFLISLGVNAVLGSVGLQFSKKKKKFGKKSSFF